MPHDKDGSIPAEAKIRQVTLLYKRNSKIDEQLLSFLEAQLNSYGYQVFTDRQLSIGIEWAKEIERQIRSSYAVIPLLSAASVLSEMLAFEIQTAHEAAQSNKGIPRILPVRADYSGPLPSPLETILSPLQYSLWSSHEDNDRLVHELLTSLRNDSQSIKVQRQRLEPAGGAVPLDCAFYIRRPSDEEFRSAIEYRDSIVLVKGARQMGKTSLLARGMQQARESGSKVVITDFQILNASHLESVDSLFLTLAEFLADHLDIDVLPNEVWNSSRGASVNFTRYMRREIIGKMDSHLVWGLDEVDRLFTCNFGSEVFGLFRSWYNARSLDPSGPWKKLTLAIAYATEAHLFITDINQSPFNVGTKITLEDFNFEQVAEMNLRYGSPLKWPAEVARFFKLVGGQPYLVSGGLRELAGRGIGITAFESLADRNEGPFGDHLRRILVLLAQNAPLRDAVRGVLNGRQGLSAENFYRLRSAGVMSGDSAKEARLRCQIYASYLARHLL